MPRTLLVLCCAAVCSTTAASPVGAAGPPPYRPPVDAPVLDPFRPPASRYGPGNRGLEYATAPGTPVHAVADGQVTVAGTRHVTVLHADGVRTTYSFLDTVEVVLGQHVRQRQRVGTTVGSLHLGARRGDAYFDPATLFAPGPPRVRLVPFDDPPGDGAGGERRAIGQLIGGIGGVLDGLGGTTAAVGGWLQGGGSQVLATMAHYAGRFTYPTAILDASRSTWQAWQRARRASARPCTPDTAPVPPPSGRRVAVLVAGLGSDSAASTVDQVRTDALGYARSDVVRFSYAGGRVPDPTDAFPSIAATTYGAPETQVDLRASAARLADLVEAVAAETPDVPIDLLAHSQGGLVVRLALIELERRHGTQWLGALGLVATLASPHGGADLATAVHALSSTRSGTTALGLVTHATDHELDHDGTSVAQLSEISQIVAELAEHPVPAIVDALSIAARGDVIVPVPRSEAPGMDEVIVPLVGRTAHSDLPGSAEATRALGLALAGLPPGCQSFGDALADQAVGEGISLAEDLGGAFALLVAARADVRAA
jgi:Peptidase family M23/Alpha/beta hydrolase